MQAILAEHIVAGGVEGEGKSSAAFHELMERGSYLSLLSAWHVNSVNSLEKAIEDAKLHKLDLNDRQKRAVEHIKEKGSISRKVYAGITKISLRQANDDINDLVRKKILKRIGSGSLIRYQFAD